MRKIVLDGSNNVLNGNNRRFLIDLFRINFSQKSPLH